MFQQIFVISLIACLAATASVPKKEQYEAEHLLQVVPPKDQDEAAVDPNSKFFFPFNLFSAFQPPQIWIPLPGLDPVTSAPEPETTEGPATTAAGADTPDADPAADPADDAAAADDA